MKVKINGVEYGFTLQADDQHLYVKPDPKRKGETLSQMLRPGRTNTLHGHNFKFEVKKS